MEYENLKEKTKLIRQDILKMIYNVSSGHPGGSLGMSDIFTALYFEILKHDHMNPSWNERDYVFLSNGHICPVLYATLARAGYFPLSELATFRKINSRLQGHPHLHSLPGIENSSGPLGQGVGQAVGAAYGLFMDGKKNTVFTISGDGELDEGQTWEAALFVGHHQLTNYIHIIDRNKIQIDGNTNTVLKLEPLKNKYESFGYVVLEINGHDFQNIINTLNQAKNTNAPVCIIANTIPGKGVSFMENKSEWHGRSPNEEEMKIAMEELK